MNEVIPAGKYNNGVYNLNKTASFKAQCLPSWTADAKPRRFRIKDLPSSTSPRAASQPRSYISKRSVEAMYGCATCYNASPRAAPKPYTGECNAQGILRGYSAVGRSWDSLQILHGRALQGVCGDTLSCTPGASLGQPKDFLGTLCGWALQEFSWGRALQGLSGDVLTPALGMLWSWALQKFCDKSARGWALQDSVGDTLRPGVLWGWAPQAFSGGVGFSGDALGWDTALLVAFVPAAPHKFCSC